MGPGPPVARNDSLHEPEGTLEEQETAQDFDDEPLHLRLGVGKPAFILFEKLLEFLVASLLLGMEQLSHPREVSGVPKTVPAVGPGLFKPTARVRQGLLLLLGLV